MKTYWEVESIIIVINIDSTSQRPASFVWNEKPWCWIYRRYLYSVKVLISRWDTWNWNFMKTLNRPVKWLVSFPVVVFSSDIWTPISQWEEQIHYPSFGRVHLRSRSEENENMKITIATCVVNLTAKEWKQVHSSPKIIPYCIYIKNESWTPSSLKPWKTQIVGCCSVWSHQSNALVKTNLYSPLLFHLKINRT